MKKLILLCGTLVLIAFSLSACLTETDRATLCPDCSDEQWRKISNPTPAEKRESAANQKAELAKRKPRFKHNLTALKYCKSDNNITHLSDLDSAYAGCKAEFEEVFYDRLYACGAINKYKQFDCLAYANTGKY